MRCGWRAAAGSATSWASGTIEVGNLSIMAHSVQALAPAQGSKPVHRDRAQSGQLLPTLARCFGIRAAMHQYPLIHRPTQREFVFRSRRDHLEKFTGFGSDFLGSSTPSRSSVQSTAGSPLMSSKSPRRASCLIDRRDEPRWRQAASRLRPGRPPASAAGPKVWCWSPCLNEEAEPQRRSQAMHKGLSAAG